MYGSGKEFLAGSAWTVNENRAGALGNLWKDVEKLRHGRTAANDILERIFGVQFFFELFDRAQVLKCLRSSDYLARIVSKNGR